MILRRVHEIVSGQLENQDDDWVEVVEEFGGLKFLKTVVEDVPVPVLYLL